MAFAIIPGLHVEPVDGGYLVLVPGRDDVVHLTGHEAEAFELARAGTDTVPDHLAEAMAGLVTLGVVVTSDWSRRKVLQLGGAAAAAGIVTIALPMANAAASTPGGGTDPSDPTDTTTPESGIPHGLYISNQIGTVAVWNGSGTAATTVIDTSAALSAPAGLAFGGDGKLYIANFLGNSVSRWDGTTVETVIASGLANPFGLAFGPDGNLYISNSDAANPSVVRWTGSALETVIASGLTSPSGLVFASDGSLLIATLGDNAVQHWDGTSLTTIIADGDGLNAPEAMTLSTSGHLLIANAGDNTVSEWDGSHVTTLIPSGLQGPYGLAIDSAGDVYVTNVLAGTVSKWSGGALTAAIDSGLGYPVGLAFH